MENRAYKGVELEKENADLFKSFLRDNHIKYEACGCYNLILVQCLINDAEEELCNSFLETL